jgi:hypothetical protein
MSVGTAPTGTAHVHSPVCPVCPGKDRQIAALKAQVEVLQRRLKDRQEQERWRREVKAKPTKVLNGAEKLVVEDLYATFKGRQRHGVDPDAPICIEKRAANVGVSPDTYGKTLRALAESGVITRSQKHDPGTGNLRVIVRPTDKFWDGAAIGRTTERDYGYRQRRCTDHPDAQLTEVRKTTRYQMVREDIEHSYVCNDCGSIVARETKTRMLPDLAAKVSETTDRLAVDDTPQPTSCGVGLDVPATETQGGQPANSGIVHVNHRGEEPAPEPESAAELLAADDPQSTSCGLGLDGGATEAPDPVEPSWSIAGDDPNRQLVGCPPAQPEPDPVELLCAIAGDDDQHVEMRPTGSAKYVTVKAPVTPELARRHIAGEVMVGANLKHAGGTTRGLCFDADTPEEKTKLVAAAIACRASGARPLLSDSPSIGHPGSMHLWLIYDQLVDAAAAFATAEKYAPELASFDERWPSNRRVRLPAGYYRRPGAGGWCAVWVPGGLHRTGAEAFALLCRELTPASWVPASWVTEKPPPARPPAPQRPPSAAAAHAWRPPTRPILNGHRDNALTELAAAMVAKAGMAESEVFDELCRIRDELCESVPGDPIMDSSLLSKARRAVRKYGGRRDG